jgi:hypothetical protein
MPYEWEHLIDVDEVLSSYITTALWATNDESTPQGGVPLDQNYSPEDVAEETRQSMRDDIVQFLDRVGAEDIEGYLTGKQFVEGIGTRRLPVGGSFPPQTPSNMGHDFFLTRNGHGAGFWDRGMGELGDRLTEISQEIGETYPYVGDDGKIYE